MDYHELEKEKKYRKEREESAAIGMATSMGMLKLAFFIIPMVLARILGFFVGIFFKMGIVGKVLLTIMFIVFALIVFSFLLGLAGVLTFNAETTAAEYFELVVLIVLLGVSVFLGIFWFWRIHYHVLKNIPISVFSHLMMISFAIVFYGSIVIGIIASLIFKNLPGEAGWAIGLGGSFTVGVIHWLIKSRQYGGDYIPPEEQETAVASGAASSNVSGSPSKDMKWARWSGDGNLYYADIIGTSGNSVNVRYYDGNEEELNKSDIFSLQEAINSGLTPHGNWEGQGSFYPCNILKMGANSVLVKYTQDGVKEEMPYDRLLFIQT